MSLTLTASLPSRETPAHDILYTIVRIKSILNKYQQAGNSLEGISIHKAANDSEKALMLEVSRFNSVMENAFEEDRAAQDLFLYLRSCQRLQPFLP